MRGPKPNPCLGLLCFEEGRSCRLRIEDMKGVTALGSTVVVEMRVSHFKLVIKEVGIGLLEPFFVEVLENLEFL